MSALHGHAHFGQFPWDLRLGCIRRWLGGIRRRRQPGSNRRSLGGVRRRRQPGSNRRSLGGVRRRRQPGSNRRSLGGIRRRLGGIRRLLDIVLPSPAK